MSNVWTDCQSQISVVNSDNARTLLSTSYTRKPELRLSSGVIEGPIWRNMNQVRQLGRDKLTHDTACAVPELMLVPLLE